MKVLAPVRYPILEQGRRTLIKAKEIALENEAELVILYVNLFQDGDDIKKIELRREVERLIDGYPAQYIIKEGFLVEEVILDEIVRQNPDLVVLGKNQESKWKRLLKSLIKTEANRYFPNVEKYIKDRADTEIIVVD
ncbi:Nucleotide-binding protein UspA family [Methanonatronarchaeum thermophilum]|uniref:Nucleotide-binding protein UspA family n=1 Tax=Methanonatronarchaeum thermophilum TaxID=1927129 RepID=A0A1Y3GCP4_9EURY|nr:universal stress protein [Methanonatronarchaeum thermophilum]OUJ19010.1 Nucleotide-binding protein UspA family [Methanonatronarchaeum thermophilum]